MYTGESTNLHLRLFTVLARILNGIDHIPSNWAGQDMITILPCPVRS